MQLAGRAHWALMIAIHDALRRDLDQLLHATASHASARGGSGCWLEGDLVPEGFKLADRTAGSSERCSGDAKSVPARAAPMLRS
jgi:hypothetical protein